MRVKYGIMHEEGDWLEDAPAVPSLFNTRREAEMVRKYELVHPDKYKVVKYGRDK